jgi:hypothetical protein
MSTVGSAMEIHRLLDEALAGVDVTADLQDLKEEMRANLVVRVAELEHSGVPADVAARLAMAELGDIRAVVNEMEPFARDSAPWVRNRVRPRPAYVVRTVALATLAAAALAVVVVPVFGPGVPFAWQVIATTVTALVAGVIVADALRQETTSTYPVPIRRAVGYGAATVLGLAGGGFAALYLRDLPLPWLVGGGLAVVASIVGFTYLLATQTNRHKPWVVRLQAAHQEVGDRFTEDPAAAARFGLYTVTIWLVALAAFAVLSFTVGWAWSWLALVAGVVAMMITLARTLFAPSASSAPSASVPSTSSTVDTKRSAP